MIKRINRENEEIILCCKEALQDKKMEISKSGTADDMYNLCKKEQYLLTNISDIEKCGIKLNAYRECAKSNMLCSFVSFLLALSVFITISRATEDALFIERLLAYIIMLTLFIISFGFLKKIASYFYKIFKIKDKLKILSNNLKKVEEELADND